MNDHFDDDLHRALRPVDPGDEFTRAVMARIQQRAVGNLDDQRSRRRPVTRILPWAPAALAASLLIVIVMNHGEAPQPSVEDGLRAREQVIEALRMTSEKLDLAYQVVHNQSDSDRDPDAGA